MTEKQEKEQTKRVVEFQAMLEKAKAISKKNEPKGFITSVREINLGSAPALINNQWI